MSDQKAPRVPAGETGTDRRVDTGYGHYWVRLVTRKAIKAEGECLSNCLRWGHYDNHAGPDDLTDRALWSLRREADGVSIALAEIDDDGDLDQFKGPQNNQASGTAYRQLKHLRDYLVAGGAKVNFRDLQVLVGDDGCTYRPDKAPKELREAIEAKRKAEQQEAAQRWSEMRRGIMQELTAEGPQPSARYALSPGQLFFCTQDEDSFQPVGIVAGVDIQNDEATQQRFIPTFDTQVVRRASSRVQRVVVEDMMRSHMANVRQSFEGLTERMARATQNGLAQQLRSLWDIYIADPTPTPAPRPAPDLTTRRGRTEAAMQRRQAQLADRRWVQENLREQRRARR